MSKTISIVGAGVAGLSLAKGLIQSGKFHTVKVFEQKPSIEPLLGAGFALTNGLVVLEKLGYKQQLQHIIHPIHVHENWRSDGSLIAEMKAFEKAKQQSNLLKGREYLWCAVLRGDLLNVIADGLPDGVIQLNKSVESYRVTPTNTVITRFTDGTEDESDVLIGADGIGSKIRSLMVNDAKPVYSGYGMWYGVAKLDPESDAYKSCEHKMKRIFGKGRYFGAYPARNDGTVIFFNAHFMPDPKRESWELDAAKDQLLNDIAGWADPVPQIVENATRLQHFGMYYREPLQGKWNDGPVTLLGDAAGGTLPFLGQGANQAIESGHVLSKLLCREDLSIEQALAEYYKRREPKTTALIQRATKKGKSLITESPVTAFVRNMELKFMCSDFVMNRFAGKMADGLLREVEQD